MEIRPATNNDLQSLAEMNSQLIKDEGHRNPMTVAELKDRMKKWLQADYQAAIIENGSETIGYALWREVQNDLYIRQFFIRAENRRNNIGTRAIESLKSNQWQGKLLRLEVLINNHRAQSFWKAVGFEEYCLTMEYPNA